MNIIKKYWIWNEKFNFTEFRLGATIEPLITKGILFKESEVDSYSGKEGKPWKVFVEKGRIKSIYFREKLPNFGDHCNWDLDYRQFEKQLNKILTPTEEDDHANDVLSVVFRDFFVAVVGLSGHMHNV